MRVLVTGKNGQLGQSIKKIVDEKKITNLSNYNFTFIGREELNFEYIDSIRSYFDVNEFNIIINCAAYTKVDKAEANQKQANLINHTAVRELATIAKTKNIKLIHISTDFVFNGLNNKPYTENDATSPLNIYGETKLAGEKAVMSISKSNSLIIRTGWVYSEFGNNFVKTILNLAKKNDVLDIVSDQFGTPTYAYDLAFLILHIINTDKFLQNNKSSEILHYSNEGKSSWYDFAKEIIGISGINCQLNPIGARDYPLAAKRPKYSILSSKKVSEEYDVSIEHWKDALKICLKNL
ncbi:dTDP-4-dehydrorhamnose reductase [Candidatus Pseudothioglobus singularis]|nr:dTDP-4-dehydrorhamnose reductase [Candidatus Pseudothioglobus singularis]